MNDSNAIHLTSCWYLKEGKKEEAIPILKNLAKQVSEGEPGTLCYLVHFPATKPNLTSLPVTSNREVTFYEIYKDQEAFHAHVNGDTFKNFVKKYGYLFEQSEKNAANDKPFHTVSFLQCDIGFNNFSFTDEALCQPAPGVMVEVIANDQRKLEKFYTKVFNWEYKAGESGFSYVHFKQSLQPRLAGIGQANSKIPGFDSGTHSYIQVEDDNALFLRQKSTATLSLWSKTQKRISLVSLSPSERNLFYLIIDLFI